MPHLATDDGVKLYYEETGSGTPVVFVHEFAGDYRSWEPQVRYFSRRYRCIAFNARGWPPSEVPQDVARYSQARACDDIRAVLDAPEDRQGAHRRAVDGRLCDAAFRPHLSRPRALAAGGGGRLRLGARRAREVPQRGRRHRRPRSRRRAWRRSPRPMPTGRRACSSRTRTRAALPSSRRCWPSIPPRARPTRSSACSASAPRSSTSRTSSPSCNVPMLVVTGDEDWPCLLPGVFIKRACPTAALLVIPNSGPCRQHRGARGLQCRARRLPGAGGMPAAGRCAIRAPSARASPACRNSSRPHAEALTTDHRRGGVGAGPRGAHRPHRRRHRSAPAPPTRRSAGSRPRWWTSCTSSACSACCCRAPTAARRSISPPGSAPWRRWPSSMPARPGASARSTAARRLPPPSSRRWRARSGASRARR